MTNPIIGCTGNTLEKDVELFRQSGCNRVLAKPFDMDLFHQCMTEFNGTNMTNKKDASHSEKSVDRFKSSNKVHSSCTIDLMLFW